MKICPQCSLANEERFPACLWCNTQLVHVRSTPAADPDHPEHARKKRDAHRRSVSRGHVRFAILFYCAVTTGLAVLPGNIHDPGLLGLYFAAALFVAVAVVWRWAGQFSAMILHGTLSGMLVYLYGPFHALTAFMLLGHVVLPGVFWHWVELIEDSHR